MNRQVIKYSFVFILLILFQVLILNNIRLNGYINPYFYVLFIIILPFQTPKWLFLISGFILGLIIDIFMHSVGIHTAATTFMAFLRPGVIRFLTGNREIEPEMKPCIRDMGFSWFFMYSLILVFFHHLVLFYLEVFRMDEFFKTLGMVVFSTILTLIMIILNEYILRRRK
ncbi:MAG: rod shape-determining protein MreD [Bacteroidetes bacterium]|nr:rod shape-determining protein MreD [Bacteroidota bacterium]